MKEKRVNYMKLAIKKSQEENWQYKAAPLISSLFKNQVADNNERYVCYFLLDGAKIEDIEYLDNEKQTIDCEDELLVRFYDANFYNKENKKIGYLKCLEFEALIFD